MSVRWTPLNESFSPSITFITNWLIGLKGRKAWDEIKKQKCLSKLVSSSDDVKIIKFITLLVSALIANYNIFSIFSSPLHAIEVVHNCKKEQKWKLSLIFMRMKRAMKVFWCNDCGECYVDANLGSGTPVAWHINWTLPPSFVTLSSTDISGELRISGGTTTSKCPDCWMKKRKDINHFTQHIPPYTHTINKFNS